MAASRSGYLTTSKIDVLTKRLFRKIPTHRVWRRLNLPMAYVLINTEPKHMENVVETLEKLDAVVEVFPVYGVYDVVAKIKTETMEKLKELVTWKVRSLDEVRSTITMLILEEKK
jgi:DNA-binding Lrp family transcriptional regulator